MVNGRKDLNYCVIPHKECFMGDMVFSVSFLHLLCSTVPIQKITFCYDDSKKTEEYLKLVLKQYSV